MRARRLSPEVRAAIARRAAIRRWTRSRFGAARFAELGMPGGALVDQGLDDLAAREQTPASLLVSLAAPRLRREGVPLPAACFRDGDRSLYRRLQEEHGELAHPRYLALLRQMVSFADACRVAREAGASRAP